MICRDCKYRRGTGDTSYCIVSPVVCRCEHGSVTNSDTGELLGGVVYCWHNGFPYHLCRDVNDNCRDYNEKTWWEKLWSR